MVNNLQQIRGNPDMEKMLGQLFSGMMPQMPPTGMQTMQAGQGQMGKMAVGHGFNKAQRFGLRSDSMKSFLSRYAGGLRYSEIKPVISTQDLLRL